MLWHDGWGAGNWLVMISMGLLAVVLTVATFIQRRRDHS